MKFVNIEIASPRDAVIAMIINNEAVNKNVRIDDSKGKPIITLKEKKGDRVKILCHYVGGPTKDNGFVQGTAFSGKITEREGITRIKGVITTEPVYHAVFVILLSLIVFQCIRLRAVSPLPLILFAFEFLMFSKEFKKQGYIQRYLSRVKRRLEEN